MESFYIVATPIGNLEDITLRAISTLKKVDFIVCEDTRVSSKLLSFYGIKKKLVVYNDHSDEKDRLKIISLLNDNLIGALISDAGTPLISDPGYKLIKEIVKANYKVTSIPGPSSIINALTLSTLPTNSFLFEGYLPTKSCARLNKLESIKNLKTTIIFLETSKRLISSLQDIYQIFGNREIVVARELTKLYEEIIRNNILDVINHYSEKPPKGEIVLLISGAQDDIITEEILLKELQQYKKIMSTRDAVDEVSQKFKIPKKDVYKLAKTLFD